MEMFVIFMLFAGVSFLCFGYFIAERAFKKHEELRKRRLFKVTQVIESRKFRENYGVSGFALVRACKAGVFSLCDEDVQKLSHLVVREAFLYLFFCARDEGVLEVVKKFESSEIWLDEVFKF